MVLYISGLTSAGLPLFSRNTAGPKTQLSFTTLAPLSGIQIYGRAHSVTFQETEGKDSVIYWKSYHDNICLILVGKHLLTNAVEDILDAVFNVLVMISGLDEILNIKHADRFKKEIRPCYTLIDKIMRTVDENKSNLKNSDLLSLSEVVITIDRDYLQKKLEEWSENIGSLFCCLLLEDKIVVATSAWWDLSADEKKLLHILVTSSGDCCTSLDIPVFLPHKSPSTPFRLVSCCLISKVWALALCGPAPDLVQCEECSAACWSPASRNLQSLSDNVMPRNIPRTFDIPSEVIAFLLLNTMVGKYVLTGCLNDTEEDNFYSDILRMFYYQNVKSIMKNGKSGHKIIETYLNADDYKLHGLIKNLDVLCVMYSSTLPNFTMRSITKNLLSEIKKDASYCW